MIDHYAAGDLLASIETGIGALGKSPSTVTVDDLGPVDEFHIGGRAATIELSERLGIGPADRVLDIGCGIGGTARLLATTTGCQVTGIDLVPDFIEVARTLTDWTNLTDKVTFEVGSALDLPIASEAFDAATLIHVGMNIEDKGQLFSEARRVLQPGALLGVYEVMRTGAGDHGLPVPWASDASHNFVATTERYRETLAEVGFEIVEERNRAAFALEFFAGIRKRTAELGGPPPLGLHVIIGGATPEKIGNMVGAISDGVVAPVEMICRAI